MSSYVLRQEYDRHLSHLETLRHVPPVTCTLARREALLPADGQPPPLHGVLAHPFFRVVGPLKVATTGLERAGWRCLVAFSPAGMSDDVLEQIREGQRRFSLSGTNTTRPAEEAVSAAGRLNGRLSDLLPQLPGALAERLGFELPKRPANWAEVVFHVGWHFPSAGIVVVRLRLQ